MTNDSRKRREELALDALAASFFCIGPDDEIDDVDEIEILDEEDQKAVEAMDCAFIGRLLRGEKPLPPPVEGYPPQSFLSHDHLGVMPGMAFMHRGDEELSQDAEDEIEQKRRKALEDTDEDDETGE
jgi:hypothetical protein